MDEDKDGVFGSKLNKKEHRFNCKSSSHIKHHSLTDRLKLTIAKTQLVKSQVVNDNCSIGNLKKILNMLAVKKVGYNRAFK